MDDSKRYPSQMQERFVVRMPDGMRDAIAAEAKKNNRSMNSEIVARLQESLENEESSIHVGQVTGSIEDLPKLVEQVIGSSDLIKSFISMRDSLSNLQNELAEWKKRGILSSQLPTESMVPTSKKQDEPRES